MKPARILTVAFLLMCSGLTRAGWGEELVQSIRWPDLAAAGKVTSGTVVPKPDGLAAACLRVAHPEATTATITLVTIERPKIRMTRYVVRGQVRYENVASGSYLEMWNHLAEGSFFTRTLGPGGPMGRLEGSSGWRPFVLPFTNREGGAPPQKLVINLVLQGPGTVEIGPLELVQLAPGEEPFADARR